MGQSNWLAAKIYKKKKKKKRMGRANPWKLGLLGGTIPPNQPCGVKVYRQHSMQSPRT